MVMAYFRKFIDTKSNLTYDSKFEEIVFNFNDFCPKSVLQFCTFYSVRFCGFKIVQFLKVFGFCGVQHYWE